MVGSGYQWGNKNLRIQWCAFSGACVWNFNLLLLGSLGIQFLDLKSTPWTFEDVFIFSCWKREISSPPCDNLSMATDFHNFGISDFVLAALHDYCLGLMNCSSLRMTLRGTGWLYIEYIYITIILYTTCFFPWWGTWHMARLYSTSPKFTTEQRTKTTTWLFSFFLGVTKILPSYISGWFQQPLFRPGPRIPNFSQPGVIHGIRKEPVFLGWKISDSTGCFFHKVVGCNNHSNWRIQLICFFFVGKTLGIITSITSVTSRCSTFCCKVSWSPAPRRGVFRFFFKLKEPNICGSDEKTWWFAGK